MNRHDHVRANTNEHVATYMNFQGTNITRCMIAYVQPNREWYTWLIALQGENSILKLPLKNKNLGKEYNIV